MAPHTHVCMFSGGVGSFAAAYRVWQEFKNTGDRIVLLFADTLIEDEDLYRFLEESAAILEDTELVWLKDGRTPWDVFHQDRFLNHRAAKCSKWLKQVPCRKWVDENCDPQSTTLYVGIDWSEQERLDGINKGWSPYQVEASLMWGDWWDKEYCFALLDSLGIEKPRLYDLGFNHNNCGGFCVRAGKKQFLQLLEHFPERYAYHAEQEAALKAYLERDDIGILREQKQGHKYRVSLKEFAQRFSTSTQLSLVEEAAPCGCFSRAA